MLRDKRRRTSSNFVILIIDILTPPPSLHLYARLKEARQCAASITSSDHRSTFSSRTSVASLKLVASSYRVEYRYNRRPVPDDCVTAISAEPAYQSLVLSTVDHLKNSPGANGAVDQYWIPLISAVLEELARSMLLFSPVRFSSEILGLTLCHGRWLPWWIFSFL